MNNSQFRSLLQNEKSQTTAGGQQASKPSMLGSRARSSIPMTPRSVGGHKNTSQSFSRQVAEHQRQSDGQPALKKFKSTSAPKGTKLAKGYEDRTVSRRGEGEELTDKEKKLKELEEMVKNEKIDQATFEKLRDQMGVGGDLGTTHLVKGLDRKLLERIRRGDDLNAVPKKNEQSDEPPPDVDDELDNALERDVVAPQADEPKPAADTDTGTPQTMTRDEILRQLKESRNAKAQAAAAPVLNEKFKKVPASDKFWSSQANMEISNVRLDGSIRNSQLVTRPKQHH
jgi:hypothetical protein